MTSRSRGGIASDTVTRTVHDYGPGYDTVSTSKHSYFWENSMQDVVVKDYKKRSALGEIFNNPMTRVQMNCKLVPLGFHKRRTVSGSTRGYYYDYWVPPFDKYWEWSIVKDAIQQSESVAITDAYARVGSADVESLVELAELRETISFILSPLKGAIALTRRAKAYIRSCDRIDTVNRRSLERYQRLRRQRRSRKRIRPPKVIPYPKFVWGVHLVYDIPSMWLAYRYALMPIVYSIDDVSKALDGKIKPERVTVRAKFNQKVSIDDAPSYSVYNYPNGYTKERLLRIGTVVVWSRAGVMYEPDWSLNHTWGLSLHRVPSTLYELIPLSFVADWFWNGAAFYDGLTAILRAKRILASWVKTVLEFNVSYVWDAIANDSYTTVTLGSPTFYRVDGTWTHRRPTSLADLRVTLRVSLNTDRIADGLALIAEFLKTARKR